MHGHSLNPLAARPMIASRVGARVAPGSLQRIASLVWAKFFRLRLVAGTFHLCLNFECTLAADLGCLCDSQSESPRWSSGYWDPLCLHIVFSGFCLDD